MLVASLCLMMGTGCNQPVTENDQMNAVIENIMTRRSIRNYKQIPVGRDTIDIIMECGINAPNALNKQSWEVRIVDDLELLNEIAEVIGASRPDDKSAQGCFRGAPVVAFIARDSSFAFSAYDCGLLAGNIVLSAHSLGVGSVCLGNPVRFLVGSEPFKHYVDMLGFSEGYELSLCVGLGYALESPDAKPRNKSKVKYVE